MKDNNTDDINIDNKIDSSPAKLSTTKIPGKAKSGWVSENLKDKTTSKSTSKEIVSKDDYKEPKTGEKKLQSSEDLMSSSKNLHETTRKERISSRRKQNVFVKSNNKV